MFLYAVFLHDRRERSDGIHIRFDGAMMIAIR
jgi:hypothetical protein